MDTTSSSPKRVPLPTTLDIYETNMYNYRRRVQRLPLRRVRLLPTTTRERLLPLRPVNVYFHLHRIELEPPRNARFKASVSFRSCEDSFVYVRLSSSWIRSSSLRDLSLQVPMLPNR